MNHQTNYIEELLWNAEITPEYYGGIELYRNHVIRQYEIYVTSVDRWNERRNSANALFLSLHTLMITTAAFLYEKGPRVSSNWINTLPLAVALLLCYVWFRVLLSYRQLSKVKFDVIEEYEKHLPTGPYVRTEWKAVDKGKDHSKYHPITNLERYLPTIFAALYVAMFVASAILVK